MINKQVNVRLEPQLLEEIKEAAEKEGLNAQDWIRNACLASLGKPIPGAVGRSEFDTLKEQLKAELRQEIESLKKH